MPVTNGFAGADYVPGENQSTVEGSVTQGFSTASTAMGAAQARAGNGSGAGIGFGFGGLASGLKKGAGTAFDLLNPSNARNAISGLLPGGLFGGAKSAPNIGFQSASGEGGATAAAEDDWRVRISLSPKARIWYQDPTLMPNSLMQPLVETNGVVFPYTPSINITHQANYTPAGLTHSNYPAHFYNNSEVADITISGDFTVQNSGDGQYLMAAVYFFRSATKMFFGQGANVGNPPPIVFLDGYGSHYFPHVPCVITSFQHQLPDDVDYIQVPISRTTLTETQISQPTSMPNSTPDLLNDVPRPNFGFTGSAAGDARLAANNAKMNTTKSEYKTITTTTRLPTRSSISISLRPMYSRKNLADNFDLNKFAQGMLLANSDTGAGGFI
jgi:hypothetical protein